MVRRLLDYQGLAEKWATGSADRKLASKRGHSSTTVLTAPLAPNLQLFRGGEPLCHTLQRWSESLHYTLEVLKISQDSSRTARFIENHQVLSAHHHGVALKSS